MQCCYKNNSPLPHAIFQATCIEAHNFTYFKATFSLHRLAKKEVDHIIVPSQHCLFHPFSIKSFCNIIEQTILLKEPFASFKQSLKHSLKSRIRSLKFLKSTSFEVCYLQNKTTSPIHEYTFPKQSQWLLTMSKKHNTKVINAYNTKLHTQQTSNLFKNI